MRLPPSTIAGASVIGGGHARGSARRCRAGDAVPGHSGYVNENWDGPHSVIGLASPCEWSGRSVRHECRGRAHRLLVASERLDEVVVAEHDAAVRTSEDHKHMRCRIWWLACGNAEEAGSGRVTTARWSERGWSAAVGEGEVEESGWFGQVEGAQDDLLADGRVRFQNSVHAPDQR